VATRDDADDRGPGSRHLVTTPAVDVEAEDVREAEEIIGGQVPRLDWTRVTLRGCLVHLDDVAELVLERARLIDSRLTEPDVTHLRGADCTWRSVEVLGGRIGAADLDGGVWDSVSVVGTRIGYVNLRDATLTHVDLGDCRIQTLDLAGARARRVSLTGCVIDELVLSRAELDEVDLRGARIGRVEGVGNLSGSIISAEQLLDLAPALAQAAGITVGPWPM